MQRRARRELGQSRTIVRFPIISRVQVALGCAGAWFFSLDLTWMKVIRDAQGLFLFGLLRGYKGHDCDSPFRLLERCYDDDNMLDGRRALSFRLRLHCGGHLPILTDMGRLGRVNPLVVFAIGALIGAFEPMALRALAIGSKALFKRS